MLDYIADNYEYFLSIARKCAGKDGHDLLHDCILNGTKNMVKANNPKSYFARVIILTAYSSTSKWRRDREKFTFLDESRLEVENDFTNVKRRAEIDIAIDRLHPFDKWVYLAYAQLGVTFKELSEDVGIPERTLYDSYDKTREYLKGVICVD